MMMMYMICITSVAHMLIVCCEFCCLLLLTLLLLTRIDLPWIGDYPHSLPVYRPAVIVYDFLCKMQKRQ